MRPKPQSLYHESYLTVPEELVDSEPIGARSGGHLAKCPEYGTGQRVELLDCLSGIWAPFSRITAFLFRAPGAASRKDPERLVSLLDLLLLFFPPLGGGRQSAAPGDQI